MKPSTLALLALVLAAGCNDLATAPPSEAACDGGTAADFTVTILNDLTGAPISGDLVLHGSVMSTGHRAIRTVTVAGLRATRDSYNFESWSATIPVATLRALSHADTGTASIVARAEDACGNAKSSDPLVVMVAPQAGVVMHLAVTVQAPGGATFLPSDGTIPATVRVTAAPTSAGGTVVLTAVRGTFDGSPTVTLVLQHLDDATSGASALVSATGAGDLTVTARGGGEETSATITSADAPAFSVSSLALLAGQEQTIRVSSVGEVATCVAGPSAAITVDVDGAPLSAVPHVVHAASASVHVVAGTTTAEEHVVVSCSDRYGQTGSVDVADRPGP